MRPLTIIYWGLTVAFIAVTFFAQWMKRRSEKTNWAVQVVRKRHTVARSVRVGEDGLMLGPPENSQFLPLSGLRGVFIETTEEGPLADDVFWILANKQGLFYVSNASEGIQEMMSALGRLRGYDHEAVLKAQSSCENGVFTVWESK